MSLSYISGKGNLKKIFCVIGHEKPKKPFTLQETELSHISGNGNPKNFLIFQEVTLQARKSNFFILFLVNK